MYNFKKAIVYIVLFCETIQSVSSVKWQPTIVR
jgi:hypothetical protein